MDFLKRNGKRVAIDTAGYLLIVAAVLTGWLPGPGGIPLLIAGLGLLSINNEWARRLRDYLLQHGGKFVKVVFPPIPVVQWLYDIIVVLLWIVVFILAEKHAAVWQVTLAVSLFFISLAITLLNRDRMERFRKKK
jgi:Putative transmembrane protein (PGPGW).